MFCLLVLQFSLISEDKISNEQVTFLFKYVKIVVFTCNSSIS